MRRCGIAKAPEGWWCSRELGHSGPCAARRVTSGWLRDRSGEGDTYEAMPSHLRILSRRSELADAANDAERAEWLAEQRALRRQTMRASTGCLALVVLVILIWAAAAIWLATSGVLGALHLLPQ